nr:unnamed protein product [Callosobruchus analis]
MPNCAVATCRNCNRNTKGKDITFFRLPKNEDMAKQWIAACKRLDEMNLKNGFIAVTDCSAAGLKTVILNLTKEYGIDLTKCREQGYDGANVMSGVYGGLQTLIKEHAPNADCVHCAAHALNLVLNDAARHTYHVLLHKTQKILLMKKCALMNDFEIKEKISEESLKYVAGFVGYKFKNKYNLGTPTSILDTQNARDWLQTISRGSLLQPNDELWNVALKLETEFYKLHGIGLNTEKHIFKKLSENTMSQLETSSVPFEVIFYFCKTRTYIRLRAINR